MADVKISELTAQASANVDVSADVLALVDTSVPQTKKISVENLVAPITLDKSNLRVGIGHTSPQYGLTMAQGSADGQKIGWEDGSNNKRGAILVNSSNDSMEFMTGASDTVALTIDNSQDATFSGNLNVDGDTKRIYIRSNDYELATIGMAGSSGSSIDQGYFRMKSAGQNKIALHTAGDSYFNGGSVGIGLASPEDLLHIAGTTASVGDTQLVLEGRYGGYGAGINFVSRTSSGGTNVSMAKIAADGEAAFDTTAANQDAGLRFFTTLNGSSAEKMRITSDGHLLTGVTSITDTSSRAFGNAFSGSGSYGNWTSWGSGSHTHAIFRNGTSIVGTITTTSSGTAYNETSDYRLKENEVLISDGLTRLNELKPYRFNFIADADTTVDGFFAHEVAEIVPEAVTGEKDAVDDEGNIISQGIDKSKLVPLLVKALQEADDKIDALTARIEALEA
tara:strand:- start:77 stop:1429 length:1353 start_codon:yes stop_codon:yes gene_type:complete